MRLPSDSWIKAHVHKPRLSLGTLNTLIPTGRATQQVIRNLDSFWSDFMTTS